MSRYRIVLRGRLSERFESAFDGMRLEYGPGRTVLAGDVHDQAQLYGLIDRLQEFGIELLAVESVEISDGGSEPAAGLLAESRLPAIGPAVIAHGDGERTGLLASAWFGPSLLVTLTMCERCGAANLTCGA